MVSRLAPNVSSHAHYQLVDLAKRGFDLNSSLRASMRVSHLYYGATPAINRGAPGWLVDNDTSPSNGVIASLQVRHTPLRY